MPSGASNGKRCLASIWLRDLKSIDEVGSFGEDVCPAFAGASADALGGKMVMDSASNIERGSKMVFALRGKCGQAAFDG